jgi:FMN phosphatase YigB (HAD superfamily)
MSPYKKYILTNAIKDHAIEVTKRIGICQAIPHSNIYSIDMAPANIMKPDPTMYHRACNHFGIQKNDIVFYFEDLKENLQPVKILYNNWKTVWICPNKETLTRIPPYVDMVFTTIEAALLHIYSILRVNKKSDARPITVPAITNGITRLPTKDSQQQRDGPVEKRSKLTNQKGN